MKNDCSRRSVLTGLGTIMAGTLLWKRFASAEMLAPFAEPNESASVARGPVGMDVTITAVTQSTIRISIAAAGEALDDYYNDGSTLPRSLTKPILKLRTDAAAKDVLWGEYTVRIMTRPLRIAVTIRAMA